MGKGKPANLVIGRAAVGSVDHAAHGILDDFQVRGCDGQGAVRLWVEDVDRIAGDRLDLFHQLRAVERAAVGDRGDEGRHLERL